ncbi:hypothetical protein [Microvirga zambiensis]|uniref:hypothetical protein n=1 Tax=Microvirga zambiensis TaxID=1402137 RepID=UPI0019203536|nr:hypothetical protein [Microvirga zambiensis]
MGTQPLDLSSQDLVLLDDSFLEARNAALFGPRYIFIHQLQTRRQRYPRDSRMVEFPQWFEARRILIPHKTRVSRIDMAEGSEWECEFLPVYVAPERALFDARRILVSALSITDLAARPGVLFAGDIPQDLGEAFEVGQSRFHVLQDFYIACAETTADPIRTLHELVAKTEGYHIHCASGSGGTIYQDSLDLPPDVVIDRESFLSDLLARRLEERFFWNWKLHAIVASRRRSKQPVRREVGLSDAPWEDELANPFAVQMLYRIRARVDECFPVSDVRPWCGTGRYPDRDLPRHWRGSLAGLRGAVDNKERLERQGKHLIRDRREAIRDSLWRFPDGSDCDLSAISFEHFGLTDGARGFLDELHPDCNDIDLPLRLMEWLNEPDAAAEAAMARYLRTWFGKLLRSQVMGGGARSAVST